MPLTSHRIYRDFRISVSEAATVDTDDQSFLSVYIATNVMPRMGGKRILFAMSYDDISIEEAVVRFMHHLAVRGYVMSSEGDK